MTAATAARSFRQPFKTVVTLSRKTGELTKSVDPAIEKTIHFVQTGITVSVRSSVCGKGRVL
jgi:hypothetical protein